MLASQTLFALVLAACAAAAPARYKQTTAQNKPDVFTPPPIPAASCQLASFYMNSTNWWVPGTVYQGPVNPQSGPGSFQDNTHGVVMHVVKDYAVTTCL